MFKEILKGRLAHCAIPRKGFIDLPFHYPFSEPNELIFSFYTNVFNGKICLTISTLKALFSISFSFFDDVICAIVSRDLCCHSYVRYHCQLRFSMVSGGYL